MTNCQLGNAIAPHVLRQRVGQKLEQKNPLNGAEISLPSPMAADNKGAVHLEGGLSKPPSHVPNVETIIGDAKEKVMNRRHQQQGHRRRYSNLPIERAQPQDSKGSQKGPQQPNILNYAPPRGSGMQAVFLDTWKRPPGTGVFFPQNADENSSPHRKLGSHVALVPIRVIEALNMKGHTLGPKVADQRENNDNDNDDAKDDDRDSIKSNEGNEKSTHRCALSQSEYISPEIFLPEEWTY
ncbi:uncharacterized protein LOC119984287 [Tripterygium wilfordii]|uniref:uncharacterized protein LOC119984287 n=1 Tax=Tripterygium wilfordii TaxID=458696 RepID=UPI0018F84E96|nr:uncharacterized protein LOC119984287 [Tripterygium wilfordii]